MHYLIWSSQQIYNTGILMLSILQIKETEAERTPWNIMENSIHRQFPLCWGLAQRRAEILSGSDCEDMESKEVFCSLFCFSNDGGHICMLIGISYYITLPLISS